MPPIRSTGRCRATRRAPPALRRGAAFLPRRSLGEAWGPPPLEAMACGPPVLTATTTSLPEVVGDAAACVDPTDEAALAAALEELLRSPARRAELRERG